MDAEPASALLDGKLRCARPRWACGCGGRETGEKTPSFFLVIDFDLWRFFMEEPLCSKNRQSRWRAHLGVVGEEVSPRRLLPRSERPTEPCRIEEKARLGVEEGGSERALALPFPPSLFGAFWWVDCPNVPTTRTSS